MIRAKDQAIGQKKNSRRGRTEARLVRLAILFFFVCSFSFFLSSCGQSAGAVPASAKAGRCPVCGMMVSSSDDWSAEIYYKDGTKILFESPADMILYYTAPGEYKTSEAQRDRANIERITIKDYQSKQLIDARQARFVYKSRVDGPMGRDFLPFSRAEDANSFAAINGGEVIVLERITRDIAEALRKY